MEPYDRGGSLGHPFVLFVPLTSLVICHAVSLFL